jgi:CAAX amino terminal protease family.
MNGLKTDDSSKIILISIGLQVILSLPVYSLQGDLKVYAAYFIPQLTFLATLGFFLKTRKVRFLSAVPFKKIKLLPVLFAILVTAGLYCQNTILDVFFTRLMERIGVKMEVILPSEDTPLKIFLAIVFLAVSPALGEEFVFRGALLSSVKDGGSSRAAVITAAVFALSHLNPAQLVHQFIMGLVLAYIVIKTGNVVYGIIMHFLNNAAALTLPLLFPGYYSIADSYIVLAALCAAGVLVLYPALYGLVKFSGGEAEKGVMEFFRFFGKNSRSVCYNIEGEKRPRSFWLSALIGALSVALIINTALLAYN